MAGTRIVMTPFDSSKKSSWLWADINGLIDTFLFVFITMAAVVGGSYALVTHLSEGHVALLMFGASMTIAFIIVFCLRRNFTVSGEPRKFRYLWRWL